MASYTIIVSGADLASLYPQAINPKASYALVPYSEAAGLSLGEDKPVRAKSAARLLARVAKGFPGVAEGEDVEETAEEPEADDEVTAGSRKAVLAVLAKMGAKGATSTTIRDFLEDEFSEALLPTLRALRDDREVETDGKQGPTGRWRVVARKAAKGKRGRAKGSKNKKR